MTEDDTDSLIDVRGFLYSAMCRCGHKNGRHAQVHRLDDTDQCTDCYCKGFYLNVHCIYPALPTADEAYNLMAKGLPVP